MRRSEHSGRKRWNKKSKTNSGGYNRRLDLSETGFLWTDFQEKSHQHFRLQFDEIRWPIPQDQLTCNARNKKAARDVHCSIQ